MYTGKTAIPVAQFRDEQLLKAVLATDKCETDASGAFALIGKSFRSLREASIFSTARNLHFIVEYMANRKDIDILVLNMRRRDWPPANFFTWILQRYPNTVIYRVVSEGLEKWTLSEVMEQLSLEKSDR